MTEAFICDAIRTPIGRYGGGLAKIRADDLAAIPLQALMARQSSVDWAAVDDVILGCANQAGEDNRNVARMAALLSGMGESVPGTTINRLCGSGLDAVAMAARAIKTGDADLVVAGGSESMTRAPFVMGKADTAFSRTAEVFDTTIGWRFVNSITKANFGIDSMPETAENIAEDFKISREDQDKFALRSQERAHAAQESGRLSEEITPVEIPQRKGDPIRFEKDEHLRATDIETLRKLRPFVRKDGTITAGNASGVNDGACVILIASKAAVKKYGLTPITRVVGAAATGVPPRIMGIGPAPATKKLLDRQGLSISDIDIIELNEAFASQGLAVMRELGLPDNANHVNQNGGAIALVHPLGMSGGRLVQTASIELR
ncbi:MAG: 3-oxoadipyl-CoA thiolase, partial [Candidatus Marinimicrobia bacterium]|nr:3-oxoadipyl-CoA thiolase [Candidatus Neomarinimicrobiota bacterium]